MGSFSWQAVVGSGRANSLTIQEDGPLKPLPWNKKPRVDRKMESAIREKSSMGPTLGCQKVSIVRGHGPLPNVNGTGVGRGPVACQVRYVTLGAEPVICSQLACSLAQDMARHGASMVPVMRRDAAPVHQRGLDDRFE